MEKPAVSTGQALNIEEEYNNTLRFVEELLETQQDVAAIPPMLQNVKMQQRTSSEIELAIAGNFDASAEASEMCRQLLRNIKSTQSHCQSMDSFLASMSDCTTSTSAIALEQSFPVRSNPFSTTTRSNFRQIHDKCSSVLQSIRSSHRRVARKLKIVKAIKKLSWTCLFVACGAAAAAAIGAATHLLFFVLLVGPAVAGLCPIALKTWAMATMKRNGSSRTGSLLRLREQLDTAAKATYVLGRDLDTVSQLVARLSDGIERENDMARWCVERAGERSSVQEMVSELRRGCSSSRRLAEELEEHVCLCLATYMGLEIW